MTKTEFRRAHSLRRTFVRFSREISGLFGEGVGLAGDIEARSLLHWFQTEYLPNASAAGDTFPCSPLGRVLNWREAYLLHERRRDVLAQFRNRRWFRKPSPLVPLRLAEQRAEAARRAPYWPFAPLDPLQARAREAQERRMQAAPAYLGEDLVLEGEEAARGAA